MDLASLDLNLLVALRALLEERNVTRAGQRIGLSQPAASAALARLRRHFGDDLLVRTGNAYDLTPLGTALVVPCTTACALLERLFTSRAEFDPRTERREFRIIASDYAIAVFGAELARVLHAEAPASRLVFEQVGQEITGATDAVLSGVDGLLMPHGIVSGFPTVELYRDEWVCLVAADHPDIGDALTMDDLARQPWVVYQRPYDAPAARQLSMLGLEPRMEVSVQNFQLLPSLVAGTRRVALIQRRLARLMSPVAQVRTLPCPFEAVPVKEALWWHPVHTQDAAHIWLRETAARVAAALPPIDLLDDRSPEDTDAAHLT
ncbi:LysR family transcriptional regulator [Actinomadura citrea]|uniref:DNA-binding transcriptional LysR family regulator n=1 Tax=Actinomadura citrea TaxID=46158 RepID=A0A7Y9GE86_9ACTN|nr:LysR family transcriptional regulator [Actinomadura citrea]NYE14819.1 DNA-binding transcriptional LysR family regulator [Actinomadura citrea]GGT82627.1 LysR family transcriptional regulator [Actinomadura citrea]